MSKGIIVLIVLATSRIFFCSTSACATHWSPRTHSSGMVAGRYRAAARVTRSPTLSKP